MDRLNNTSREEPMERDPQDAKAVHPVAQPDAALRRNPCEMDIQEGQERMQADPDPRPSAPPGKLNDHIRD